jgi:hypothetical protein
MTDNLRERVLAAVRKGLADPVGTPKALKPRLRGYTIDSAKENAVTSPTICNQTSSTEIKGITASPPVSANMDSQPKKPVEPSGATCKEEIVELPQAQRYRKTFGHLQLKPPEYVREDRWEQAVEDGRRFLAAWSTQAEALGWTSADLFGLAPVPDRPHPSYRRLSRYDLMGLIWLLEGKEVIALTSASATIRNSLTGNVTVYRKDNKPALGPLGDSLDDFS